MSRENTQGLALAGGHATTTAPVHRGGPGRSGVGLGASLLRALGWPQSPTAPQHAPLRETAAQCEPTLPYEKHFANENEAGEYAREVTARGYRTQVHYDMYDFSWSVEVREAAPPATVAPVER